MKKFLAASALASAVIFNTAAAATPDRETINQIALLQSLTLGYFDGTTTVTELKTLGDTGLGTFDGLNGELIMLDGTVYRANQNCELTAADAKATVPFANVTFFDRDFALRLRDIADKNALEARLNEAVDKRGRNVFYMVRLTADFNEILVRSEAAQKKPYPTLVEALAATQQERTLRNTTGTIVGLYCPPQMQSLNATGWRFHFVSSDKKFGGHVLELNLRTGEAQFDKTDSFSMRLPAKKNFNELNLGQDLSADINSAEKDRRQ